MPEEQAGLSEPAPPEGGDPANSASNTNQNSPTENSGANANDSDPASGSNDSGLPLPPPSLEPTPVEKQAGLPKSPPRYGDPGEGGMGLPPPADRPPVTGPTSSPLDVSKILEGLFGGQPPPQQTPPDAQVSGITPNAPPQAQPPVTQPAATPAQPPPPTVTPATGQQAAAPQPTEVLTLCYKATYLEGQPLVCTETGGPYCNDGSSINK